VSKRGTADRVSPGIQGIESEHFRGVSDGLLIVPQLPIGLGPVSPGGDQAGVKLDCPRGVGDGMDQVQVPEMGGSPDAKGQGIVRVQPERLRGLGDGPVGLTLARPGLGPHVAGQDGLRVQGQNLPGVEDGAVEVLPVETDLRSHAEMPFVCVVEADGLVSVRKGAIEVALHPVGLRAEGVGIVEEAGVGWSGGEANDLAGVRDGAVHVTLPEMDFRPQPVGVGKSRVDADGLAGVSECLLVGPLQPQTPGTGEMQVGVAGADRKASCGRGDSRLQISFEPQRIAVESVTRPQAGFTAKDFHDVAQGAIIVAHVETGVCAEEVQTRIVGIHRQTAGGLGGRSLEFTARQQDGGPRMPGANAVRIEFEGLVGVNQGLIVLIHPVTGQGPDAVGVGQGRVATDRFRGIGNGGGVGPSLEVVGGAVGVCPGGRLRAWHGRGPRIMGTESLLASRSPWAREDPDAEDGLDVVVDELPARMPLAILLTGRTRQGCKSLATRLAPFTSSCPARAWSADRRGAYPRSGRTGIMPTGRQPAPGGHMNTTVVRPDDADRDRTSPRSTESGIIRLLRAHRPVLALAGLLAVFLLFNDALRLQGRQPPPDNPTGIWDGEGWPFRYDCDTVYLHMFRLHAWEEGPEDDVWRLKARWKGNTLCYLGPYGRWGKLGKFVEGRFVRDKKTLNKVDVAKLDGSAKDLAKDRPIWHYPALAAKNRPRTMTVEWGAEESQPVKPSVVLEGDPNGVFEIDGQPAGSVRLAWSPDGKRLVSFTYSWDPVEEKNVGFAKVWDTVAGRAEGLLEGLPALVWDAAFSPDGRRLALAGDDGVVRIWDSVARRELSHDKADGAPVRCLAFSNDGKLLASAGEGKDIVVRKVGTAETQLIRDGHKSVATRLNFSRDGSRLFSASPEEGVRVVDLASGKVLQDLTRPGRFCAAAFDPEGKHVAVGGYGPVKVWNLNTGKPVGRFSTREAHARAVGSIACSPDGRYVASGGERGDIRFWESSTGRLLFVIKGCGGDVRSVAFSPDGKRLAASAVTSSIEIWDVAQLLKQTPPPGGAARIHEHTDYVSSVVVAPDGKTAASGSWDETICLWDVASAKLKAVLRGHVEAISCMACSPDGRILASGSGDGEIKLWDLATGKEQATLDGHDSGVHALAFSPDGKTLASGSGNGQLKLWDAATRREKRCITGKLGPVSAIAYSPDGKVLAVGGYVREWDERLFNWASRKGQLLLLDASSGEVLHAFPNRECAVTCLAISADGATLAASSNDQTVCLYDLRAKKELAVLKGHAVFLHSVAMTRDGKLIASADWNGMIRLWNAGSARLLARFVGHERWINTVAFTPDGKKLISGGGEGLVKFWDVAEVLGRMEADPKP
jgi:WD40 repeat protein